jgi:hypothetical protein
LASVSEDRTVGTSPTFAKDKGSCFVQRLFALKFPKTPLIEDCFPLPLVLMVLVAHLELVPSCLERKNLVFSFGLLLTELRKELAHLVPKEKAL